MAVVDVTVSEGTQWPVSRIETDAVRILGEFGLDEAELSVLLCDDATIRPLNRQYRDKDKPTDVLSFSQLEGEAVGRREVIGDVVISVETAMRQAREHGHDTEQEVRVLLVHGICHLLGYDHEDDDEAEEMEALERDLLEILHRAG